MRLINVKTLAFESFYTPYIPPYAILSHRWRSENEEPTYKDWRKGRNRDKPGYRKVLDFCSLCVHDEIGYAWADTVCIDKSSSAELSEAINSMFSWYRDAYTCYVYLADVNRIEDLPQSVWFRRGWTLQELIAPFNVVFCDSRWQSMATKEDLKDMLFSITGIPSILLRSPDLLDGTSIAQRMSFAAGRSCSRIEDETYCLLGLFNVNMPLLYGEGRKAFERLQLHILEQSDDESIFAWTKRSYFRILPASLLARSVNDFLYSDKVVRISSPTQHDRPPWRMTNKGLEFWATPEYWLPAGTRVRRGRHDPTVYIVPLACALAPEVMSGDGVPSIENPAMQMCAVALALGEDGSVYERVAVETLGSGLESAYPKVQRRRGRERKFYVRGLQLPRLYPGVEPRTEQGAN